MEFEAYLASKRIDSARFSSAEPALWQSWKTEFEQLHPNSFTVQKLNLINPIRRKYQLAVIEAPKAATQQTGKPTLPTGRPAVPVVKPALGAGEPAVTGSPAVPPVRPTDPDVKPSVPDADVAPPSAQGEAPKPAKVVPRIPRPGMPKPVVRPSPDANSVAAGNHASSTIDETKVMTSTQEDQGSRAGNVDGGLLSTDTATPSSSEDVAANTRVTDTEPPLGKPDAEKSQTTPPATENPAPPAKPARPVIPRPVIKPKPKPN